MLALAWGWAPLASRKKENFLFLKGWAGGSRSPGGQVEGCDLSLHEKTASRIGTDCWYGNWAVVRFLVARLEQTIWASVRRLRPGLALAAGMKQGFNGFDFTTQVLTDERLCITDSVAHRSIAIYL